MDKIQVVVVGPFGKKLGQPVCQALRETEGFQLFAQIIRPGGEHGILTDPEVQVHERFNQIRRDSIVFLKPTAEQQAQTVVFYAIKAEALYDRVQEAIHCGFAKFVIGTTGLDASTVVQLRTWTRNFGLTMVCAPNFSEGAWIGAEQCVELAVYKPDYHAEIVEAHHWQKADAPSGTAKMWARAIALARGLDPNKVVKCGRSGDLGKRDPEEIWISSVRGGSVTGYHRATFYGPHDEISVEHNVRSSELFAQGALRAIRWAATEDRQPGFYGMPHVLGLAKLIELGLA